MKFFISKHCTSRGHCERCRDKDGGRAWRSKLRKSCADIKTDDFECPAGVEWIVPRPKVLFSHFNSLYKEIMEESKDEWLRGMAAQCKSMYDDIPEGMTCKSKRAFRDRWYKKLKYYRNEANNKETT